MLGKEELSATKQLHQHVNQMCLLRVPANFAV